MQVLTVIGRVLLAALAASAAKLPLPPQLSTLYEAPLQDLPVPAQTSLVTAGISQVPVEIPQVPAELSTLYEAPLEDLPVPAQTSLVTAGISQVPVEIPQVPAELSTLYEAPVADLPSQSSIQAQSSGLPVPAEQTGSIQVQSTGGLVHTHPELSTSLGLPSLTLSVPDQQPTGPLPEVPVESSAHQQPGFTHNSHGNSLVSSDQTVHHASSTSTGPGLPVQIFPEPIVPSTLYDIPAEENLIPIHQSPSISTPFVNVPVAVEPTVLQPIPVDNTPFSVGHVHVPSTPEQINPVFDEQIVLVQTHDEIVPVPGELSTLYGVPDQDFQLHSQTSQTSSAVLPEQTGPETQAVIILEESSDSSAPLEPSGIYETPEAAFPVQAESTLPLVQSSAGLPSNEEFSPVQSTSHVTVPVRPLKPIQFPEQGPSIFIPEPSVPSTLYETPIPSAPSTFYGTPVAPGKAMTAEGDQQKEPSSLYEVPAASEPVATVIKGGMMMGMPYNFQYGVDDDNSGAMFTHVERSDGKSTSGQYKVTLPDGRVQVVNFYDNGDGFHADISYE